MRTHVFGPDEADAVAALLRGGGIAAIPTDTVYGLAAHPVHPTAIDQLFIAKRRPREKAIPVLISSTAALDLLGIDVSDAVLRLAAAFWPGPLTMVLHRRSTSGDQLPTVAVRIPALELARQVIEAAGGALAVTSANISGAGNTTTAAAVLAQLDGRIDAILDGGPCPGGVESTIVDVTALPIRVLRQGGLPVPALAAIVPLRRDGSLDPTA